MNALNFCSTYQQSNSNGGLEGNLIQFNHLPENYDCTALTHVQNAKGCAPTGFDDVRNRFFSAWKIVIQRSHLKFQNVEDAIQDEREILLPVLKITLRRVRQENVISSHKFRKVIPKCIRFDRRGRFTTGEGSVPRSSTLTVKEDTKELEACGY
jgi:hypothetical protein